MSCQLLELLVKCFLLLFIFLGVLVELLLLLLHAPVVNLLEFFLLLQLIVGRLRLLSNDARLIQLHLHRRQLVRKLCIFAVNLWYLGQLAHVDEALCLQFEPLLLEALEGGTHAELNEEVAQELVRVLEAVALLLIWRLVVVCCLSVTIALTKEFESLLSIVDESVVVIKVCIRISARALCIDIVGCV